MESEKHLVQCYNRGCGQKFNPAENGNDSCCHHPGLPFFHDAYKGWSCCKKKYTDFTEFLNTKGCTTSKHSNEKPQEPEKPTVNNIPDVPVVVVKPLAKTTLSRPSFDSELKVMSPEISSSLKQQIKTKVITPGLSASKHGSDITVGTTCKNSGCTTSYHGPQTNQLCVHHPGSPIFHEGMKYWSCCQKKTTDFNTFLSQVGCNQGEHLWIKECETDLTNVQCRWDWHQTGTHVVVSIYGKDYCPNLSIIKLNPVRLYANLVFPQQANATFNLDVELCGIINVEASKVSMFGIKVEMKLKKAEPGSWVKLDIPKAVKSDCQAKQDVISKAEELSSQVEEVDLSDL